MKRYVKKIINILLVCVMMVLISMVAYAQTEDVAEQWNVKIADTKSEYVNSRGAKIVATPKGMLLSSVEISLVNLGKGVAEIYADALCHEAMKKIKMVLYLEKWNESQEDWNTEERFEYEWRAEDYPDKDLSMAAVSFNVYGLDRGYKYRVKGLFGAYDLDSDNQEIWQAWTSDVYFD